MNSMWKSIANIAAGVLVGFAGGMSFADYHRPPPPPPGHGPAIGGESFNVPGVANAERGPQRLLNRYGEQLHLSDDQREKVRALLAEKQLQMLQLRTEMLPKLWSLESETTEGVRKILTDDQKRTFDQMNGDQMNGRDGGDGPPRPGPMGFPGGPGGPGMMRDREHRGLTDRGPMERGPFDRGPMDRNQRSFDGPPGSFDGPPGSAGFDRPGFERRGFGGRGFNGAGGPPPGDDRGGDRDRPPRGPADGNAPRPPESASGR